MARLAKDIAEVVQKRLNQKRKRMEEKLELRCIEAVTEMIKDGKSSTEIPIAEDDFLGFTYVTSKLVELGYKYCLIETQDEQESILSHRFRISVGHLVDL